MDVPSSLENIYRKLESSAYHDAFSWYSLGLRIHEPVYVNGRQYTDIECFVTALQNNPRLSDAWCALGSALLTHKSISRVHTVKGTVGCRECFIHAVNTNASNAQAWISLAEILESDMETVTTTKGVVTRKECFVWSLSANPKSPEVWFSLGSMLSRKRVLKDSDSLKDSFSSADRFEWNEEIVYVRGEPITKLVCYTKTAMLNPRHTEAWFRLGMELRETSDFVVIFDQKITKVECFAQTVSCNPNHARAWFEFGLCILLGREVTVEGVGLVSKRDCLIKALEVDPTISDAWCALGHIMRFGETVQIGPHKNVSKQMAYAKSLELNPQQPRAWCGLGNSISVKGSTLPKIKDVELKKKDCFSRALELQPQYEYAWYGLGASLRGEPANVKNQMYTKRECMLMGNKCGVDKGISLNHEGMELPPIRPPTNADSSGRGINKRRFVNQKSKGSM